MLAVMIVPKPNLSFAIRQELDIKLLRAFGSFSAYTGEGVWTDKNGNDTWETHWRFEIFTHDTNRMLFNQIVQWVKTATEQQLMYIIVDGKPEFV